MLHVSEIEVGEHTRVWTVRSKHKGSQREVTHVNDVDVLGFVQLHSAVHLSNQFGAVLDEKCRQSPPEYAAPRHIEEFRGPPHYRTRLAWTTSNGSDCSIV